MPEGTNKLQCEICGSRSPLPTGKVKASDQLCRYGCYWIAFDSPEVRRKVVAWNAYSGKLVVTAPTSIELAAIRKYVSKVYAKWPKGKRA